VCRYSFLAGLSCSTLEKIAKVELRRQLAAEAGDG
jgi:hypothetical protein